MTCWGILNKRSRTAENTASLKPKSFAAIWPDV